MLGGFNVFVLLWIRETGTTSSESNECRGMGKDGIKVNVVNPHAVIRGSKIWEGDWANGRD